MQTQIQPMVSTQNHHLPLLLIKGNHKMKSVHMYEVKLLDGTRYKGEIAYRDEKMVVLRLHQKLTEQKLCLFYSGILSIRELGWQRIYASR